MTTPSQVRPNMESPLLNGRTCTWEDNRMRICERPAPFEVIFTYPERADETESVCMFHALILVGQWSELEWREMRIIQ